MSDEKILFEVCCGSADDVYQAYLGGADRVELNSALFHGGLTPSIGTLIEAKRLAPLPIMCMVRPREGGFYYSEAEFAAMLTDAELLLTHGADGIVFGFLHEDGTIDTQRCNQMLAVIGEKQSVFNRAIDVVPDVFSALDHLMAMGVTRVLTSGQAPTVPEGIEMLKKMIDHVRGNNGRPNLEILPGGGIQLHNAAWCHQMLGIDMFHAMAHKPAFDKSACGNPSIYYGGAIYPPEDRFLVADSVQIAQFCSALSSPSSQ